MFGSDASQFLKSLWSSLGSAQKAQRTVSNQRSNQRSASAVGSDWSNWLIQEQSKLDGAWTQPGRTVSSRLPVSSSGLPQFMETLSPLVQPRRWGEATAVLKNGRETKGAQRVLSVAKKSEGLVPSQFDPSISPAEAKAACGPAAAVAFARASGKNTSLSQAVELARTVGWTTSGGMNGVSNQKRLLDKMGIPAVLDSSGDWSKIARTVSAGSPVTISTPGHYFVADSYDEQTGRFHVGASGTAYQGGKEWMTCQEMEGLAGRANGTLVMKDRSRWMA
jgi:hypothetical protein